MPEAESAPADSPFAPLLQEGLTKSGVLWLGPSEHEAQAAWFAYVDPHVYVVTGPGEQPLPSLEHETVLVLRGKDALTRILVVPAGVERLSPDDERWESATAALAKGRLNAPLLPSELPAHWAAEATVFALTPALERAHR